MISELNTQTPSEFDLINNGVGYSSDRSLAKYFDASRSTIWLWTREGRLPKPVKLSNGSTRWQNKAIQEFTARAAL